MFVKGYIDRIYEKSPVQYNRTDVQDEVIARNIFPFVQSEKMLGFFTWQLL